MLKGLSVCAARLNPAWDLLRQLFPTLQVLVLVTVHGGFPVCAWSRNTEVRSPVGSFITTGMAAVELRFRGDALAR